MFSKQLLCFFISSLLVAFSTGYTETHINVEEVIDENSIYYETGNYSDIEGGLLLKVKEPFPTTEVVVFESSKFLRIPRNLFEIFPNAVSIELKDCGIKAIEQLDFISANSLKRLNLRQNDITYLHDEVFSFMENLELLDLQGNSIVEVSPRAFVGLDRLEFLELSDNSIKVLLPDVFAPLINLQHINLENCLLETLSNKIFEHNLKLENISVSSNQISEIGRSVFTHLTHLDHLAVDGNRLYELFLPAVNHLYAYDTGLVECHIQGPVISFFAMNNQLRMVDIQNVSALEKVFVSNNQITNITNLRFAENLIDLDISNNPIDSSTVTPELFAHMEKLEFLDLSGLGLIRFDDNRIFSKLDNVRVLYLASNKFRHLDANLFIPMKSLAKLVISDNSALEGFDIETLRNAGFTGDVYGV